MNSEYDALRRLAKTSTLLNNQQVNTEHTYDSQTGYLTGTSHNTDGDPAHSVVYHFGYDSLSRQTSVSVGSNVLSTTYKNEQDIKHYSTRKVVRKYYGKTNKYVGQYIKRLSAFYMYYEDTEGYIEEENVIAEKEATHWQFEGGIPNITLSENHNMTSYMKNIIRVLNNKYNYSFDINEKKYIAEVFDAVELLFGTRIINDYVKESLFGNGEGV